MRFQAERPKSGCYKWSHGVSYSLICYGPASSSQTSRSYGSNRARRGLGSIGVACNQMSFLRRPAGKSSSFPFIKSVMTNHLFILYWCCNDFLQWWFRYVHDQTYWASPMWIAVGHHYRWQHVFISKEIVCWLVVSRCQSLSFSRLHKYFDQKFCIYIFWY